MPPLATKKPPPRPRQQTMDIYNSTSTGHQVGSGVSKSTSWYKSRISKLQQQFRNHSHPGSIIETTSTTTVLITTKTPDTSLNETAPHSEDHRAPSAATTTHPPRQQDPTNEATFSCTLTSRSTSPVPTESSTTTAPALKPTRTPARTTPTTTTKIFTNCTIYVNGTTAPAISDLVLKRYLSTHGASITTMLTRKSVTHVILGKLSSAGGAGGGLAAGKLQKELTKKGKHIKFVSVEWALDSIKAGKRLSETNYAVMNMHSQSQRSIKGFAKGPLKVTNAKESIIANEADRLRRSQEKRLFCEKIGLP